MHTITSRWQQCSNGEPSSRMYSLWWVEQALSERKISFDFKHASLASHKQYAWRSGKKQKAGMKMVVTANRSKTPKN